MSSDEDDSDRIRVLGPKLWQVYNALWNEIAQAHFEWQQFNLLFAQSSDRIDMLNRAAGPFFGMLQRVLFENTVMHLSRLTEGPKSGRHDVLGLPQIPELLDDPVLRTDVSALIDDAKKKTLKIKRWRDNRVAHRSLLLAKDEPSATGISRRDVEESLSAVRAVMNRVQRALLGSETHYQGAFCAGGAEDLCMVLHRGIESWARREARMASGVLRTDDLDPLPNAATKGR